MHENTHINTNKQKTITGAGLPQPREAARVPRRVPRLRGHLRVGGLGAVGALQRAHGGEGGQGNILFT